MLTKYTLFRDENRESQKKRKVQFDCTKTGLVSSVKRALSSKLRGPEFKSRPGTVGGQVTIIMWSAQTG